MRVTLCIDALGPQLGGIGRYTLELARGLGAREDIDLKMHARGRLVDNPNRLLAERPLRRLRFPFRQLARRRVMQAYDADIVHGPNYFLPPRAEAGVVTIHDLSVFRFPETHPAKRVRMFEERFAATLKRAEHIICDTETVRKELIDTFGLQEAMVSATLLGVDPAFGPREPDALTETLAGWNLRPGGYGLCVSTLEPRKNISKLIAAWRRLGPAVRSRMPLVLAGGSGWENSTLREEIEAASAEGWLHHLGFVAEAELPALYAGAALFAYPSIYEGFGLPPLEAMASGVPTIVSNRSCLPEVCGDAALYIDPDDADGFTAALQQGLEDKTWRSGAIERGLKRAATFTWARCVKDTVGVYRKVIAGR